MRMRTRKRQRLTQKGGSSWLGSIIDSIKSFGTPMKSGKGTKKITDKPLVESTNSKMICNPGGPTAVDSSTCYSKDVLYKIQNAYNENHPDRPIKTTCPKKIVEELRCRLLPKCKKEDCWLNLLPKSQRDLLDKQVFAPDKPPEWKHNSDEWLSNFDIQHVLDQYETGYDHFELLGPTPIDFDTKLKDGTCVSDEICNFKLASYRKQGTTDVAFVFNLDKHNEPGSHWTSMYLNIPHRTLFYFDSALNSLPPEVDILKTRIIEQAQDLGITLKFDKNTIQHQKKKYGMWNVFLVFYYYFTYRKNRRYRRRNYV